MSIFAMLGEDIKTAGEYQQAFLRFKQMNMGDALNKEADTFAKSTDVFNTSSAGLMDTLTDLRGVIGSFSAAKAMAPLVAGLNAANAVPHSKGVTTSVSLASV